MKKIFSIMLIVFMTFGLVACKAATQDNSNENATSDEDGIIASEENTSVDESELSTVPTSSERNVLVVYFSVTGNTKNIAEKIAAVSNADIYEIKAAVEYTDADINYNDSSSRTSKEQNDSSIRPEIQSDLISLDGYDIIYIGYPIWWGEEPRIMDTYVESYNFEGITMIPFCTSGSSGIGNSGKNLENNAGSGNWLEGKRFDSSASESEIEEWVIKQMKSVESE